MPWFKGPRADRQHIYIAMPVWGKSYIDVFLAATLPAMLAPKNLPALATRLACHCYIYTDALGEAQIRSAEAFTKLSGILDVAFKPVVLPDPALDMDAYRTASYEAKSNCYRECLSAAQVTDSPSILLNADIIMADGFMSHIADLLDAGKRVLEVPGPRALKDPVVDDLTRDFMKGGVISIEPKDLAALWTKHLHPLMLRHFWDESRDPTDFHPSHLYWRVGESDVLAHCFHLYPIMIWPRFKDATFRATIDDVLVESAAPSMNDTEIAGSDQAFCIELSSPDHFVGKIARRTDYESIAKAFTLYGADRNLKLLRRPIRIRGGDAVESEWRRFRWEAGNIVSDLIAATLAYRG